MKAEKRLIIIIMMCFLSNQVFCQITRPAIRDTTTVIKVEVHSTGSENGGLLDLSISKDSTTYFCSGFIDEKGRLFKTRSLKEKTDLNFWKKLLGSINLTDFDNAPGDKPLSQIDGIDVSLAIKTGFREHRIILNHSGSKEGYKKIAPFTDLLLLQLHHFNKKMWIFND